MNDGKPEAAVQLKIFGCFLTRDNEVSTFLNSALLVLGQFLAMFVATMNIFDFVRFPVVYLCHHRNDIFDRTSGHLLP